MPSAFDLLFRVRPSALGLLRPHGLRRPAPGSSYVPHADEYDRQRGTACKRGYDRQWRNVRAAYLEEHPTCEVNGCTRPAAMVDHIVKVRVDPARRLDWDNLQAMCWPCHALKSAAGL